MGFARSGQHLVPGDPPAEAHPPPAAGPLSRMQAPKPARMPPSNAPWLDRITRSMAITANGMDAAAALEHELRTPLTTIRAVAGILRDYPDLEPRERERLLAALVQDAERLTHGVNRLLAAILG